MAPGSNGLYPSGAYVYADKAAFQTLMRDFLVSLREYNCDQWTQSSLALQLEAQQKETQRQQVASLPTLGPRPCAYGQRSSSGLAARRGRAACRQVRHARLKASRRQAVGCVQCGGARMLLVHYTGA